jgi:hypothetical protein
MKKLTLIMMVMFISTSFASSRCSEDYFGNFNCSYSDGSSSRTSTDYFGNDNTSFSDGSRMSCSTDYFGNYNCN